jgi:hypothetical protein
MMQRMEAAPPEPTRELPGPDPIIGCMFAMIERKNLSVARASAEMNICVDTLRTWKYHPPKHVREGQREKVLAWLRWLGEDI